MRTSVIDASRPNRRLSLLRTQVRPSLFESQEFSFEISDHTAIVERTADARPRAQNIQLLADGVHRLGHLLPKGRF